jgi:hypothetical protein
MKIINETELMNNQKASTVVVPDKQFEALQTSDGSSLLFSIGVDSILYCTREVSGDTHGWIRCDLSTALSAQYYNGQSVVAKTFDIAQDLSSVNTVDMALVVTVGAKDYLHLATGFTSTPAWQQFLFDDPANPAFSGLPINEVQIVDGNGSQYIIADLVTNANTQTISRYYIDTTLSLYDVDPVTNKGKAWVPHNLSIDLQAGQITTLLGCGPSDGPNGNDIGGAYVLGAVNNTPQLMYAPTFNFFNPEMKQDPTIFNIPAGADASHMAMALSASATNAPYTDLFFASNGSLYFLANADQVDTETTKPTPTLIYSHALFNQLQSMHIENWNDNIVLWGQSLSADESGTSQLFIMDGVAGQETDSAAWSCPVPLLFNVENSATYINNKYSALNSIDPTNGNAYGSCNVLFAHQADGSLVQLFQDPVTTAWQERFLLTEPLDANTVLYETTSYTSHIRITDDNNMVQPFLPVSIWSSSPCSLYVNNVYSNLEFTAPLQTTADESGFVNIMQPVDTLGGVSYYIAVQDPNTNQWYTQVVNPLAVTTANIATQVPDDQNNHLGGNVTDEMGKSTPLVNSSNANADTQKQTSQSIYSFGQHYSSLNADGLATGQTWPAPGVSAVQSVQKAVAKPDRLAKNLRFNPATDKIWGMTFGKNAKYYNGIEAMKEMGVIHNADGSLSLMLNNGLLGSSNWLESKGGHLFKWMKSEAHKLEKLVVQIGTDGLDCLMTIAGDIYHFVVKCMNDIVNAMHTLLNSIETAFADLIKWIGSIFAWHDFIATHSVIKNLFIQYGNYCVDNVDLTIAGIEGLVSNVMGAIDKWAGFPDDSGQSQSKNNNQDAGQHSPQSNWGHHQTKNNADNSVFNVPAGEFGEVVQGLVAIVEKEGEILSETLQKLQGIDITSISMADLLKKIVDIIADDVLQSMQDILTTFLGVVADIIQGMMDTLVNETIKIPVISPLYERFVGSPLSILDLICLITSIPITVTYKLLNKGVAPFPAGDPDTLALAGAKDYLSIAQLCTDQPAVQNPSVELLGDISWNPPPLNDRWYRLFFAGNVMALFGGIFIGVFGFMKTKAPTSKNLARLYALSYFPYIGPDIVGNIPGMIVKDSRWYSVLNGSLAATGVIKAFWDIRYVSSPVDPDAPAAPAAPGWLKTGKTGYDFFSPILDAVLNGVWELPVFEAFTHSEKNVNDIVDLVANTLFNASGVISPLVTFEVPPQPLWLVTQSACNVLYGAGSFAESVDGQPIDPISV